jgi:hypothetical protein
MTGRAAAQQLADSQICAAYVEAAGQTLQWASIQRAVIQQQMNQIQVDYN